MTRKIVGHVQELFLYPVKSMRGISVREVTLYWYGANGDRKYAFTQAGDLSGFPWLTARELPVLLQYQPYFVNPASPLTSDVRVRTPERRELALEAPELIAQLAALSGLPVSLVKLKRGTYDCMPLSIITTATLKRIERATGPSLDRRRFRPNIVVHCSPEIDEAAWVNCSLTFGESEDTARVTANYQTKRCTIINLDPDSSQADSRVLHAVATNRDSRAGLYASVSRLGSIRVGQPVFLEDPR